MQVQFYGVTSVAAGEKTQLFQPDGIAFWTRRLAIFGPKGRVDHVVLFAESEAALALPGEKESAPLLSPPREPLLSPPRRKVPAKYEVESDPPMELPF